MSNKLLVILLMGAAGWWFYGSYNSNESMQALTASPNILFAAKGVEKSKLYVFTDPDCSACRHLHKLTPELNEKGVSLYFYPLPLMSGVNYDSSGKATGSRAKDIRNVWCSNHQQRSFNALFHGSKISNKPACETPLEKHLKYAKALKVRGVPTLFDADGNKVSLMGDADSMIRNLGL